jgi:hypothetical protein
MLYGDRPPPERNKMSAEERDADEQRKVEAMCEIWSAIEGGPKSYDFSYDRLDPRPPPMIVDGVARSSEEHPEWPAWRERWMERYRREFDFKVDPWDPESGLT